MAKLLTLFLIFYSCSIANGRDSVIGPQWTLEKSFTKWLEEQWAPLKSLLENQEMETIVLSFRLHENGMISSLNINMNSPELSAQMTKSLTDMPAWMSARWGGKKISAIVYAHILIGNRFPSKDIHADPPAHICLWNSNFTPAHGGYESDFSWSTNLNVRMLGDNEDIDARFNEDVFHYSSIADKMDSLTLNCLKEMKGNIGIKMKKIQESESLRPGILQLFVNAKGEISDIVLRYSLIEEVVIPEEIYLHSTCNLPQTKIQGKHSPMVWTLSL